MSGLTTDLARRYLFGKKSTNSINIITGISIFGISIGTAALVLILSVFNGFEGLISGLFNAFNPDLKIIPVEGKFLDSNDELLYKLNALPGVVKASATLEEIALFEYKSIQEIGMIKGVDDAYLEVTQLDSLLIDGEYKTKENNIHYGMVGVGLRNKLSLNIDDKISPITVYMPTRKKKLMGTKDFNSKYIYPAGVFSVKSDNDYQYVLTSYELATSLLEMKNKASFIEVKISSDAESDEVKASIHKILPKVQIKDRYEQDEVTLKVMRIEKWISFLITGLTMLLIAFNLLGALWMIVLDKRKDISVLKALGLGEEQVKWLFLKLGFLITVVGIILGFTIALVLYYIQKEFGLIGVPASFMMDSYPVKLKMHDFLIVFVTVFTIGGLASLLPALKAAQNMTILRS